MKKINLEIDDFEFLRKNDYLYIDKTLLIKEIIDEFDKPCLFPRPRRFGKTLNMSMLNYYFNMEYDSKDLFKGLKIMDMGEEYLKEMNKYPVIFLSLKDLKKDTYQEFIDKYKTLMSELYTKYKFILDNPNINKSFYNKIINMEEDSQLADALSYLVRDISKYYGLRVIVLLDEYDAPILHGYNMGYYDKVITFMKQLFVTTFKNNPNLKKCVITGILRVSKENMFSDANNINIYNITDNKYSTYFGFTESEVKEVLKEYNLSNNFNDVKKWYDGYLFSETTIYNPISILMYLENSKHELKPYWINTGGVDLIKNLIYNLNNKQEILNSYEKLLKNGIIEHINLNINLDLNTLDGNKDNIYTLFMFCGYLTPNGYINNLNDATLRIPNLEIRENLENIVKNWFDNGPLKSFEFTEYLYNDQLELFKENFENVVIDSFSYYDVPNTNNGENFYHAFTMGLLMSGNSNYEITSNRESGYGRYDLILKPFEKNKTAYIIEFKVSDLNFDKTIDDGFKQIEERSYDASLKDYKIVKMIIAFKGKKLKIETR